MAQMYGVELRTNAFAPDRLHRNAVPTDKIEGYTEVRLNKA